MAIISNATLYWAHLDPARPNARFNKENPTWDVQIRTYSKAQKAEWEAQGLKMKAEIPDEGAPYWTANLRRSLRNAQGKINEAPVVKDGKGKEIDGNTIGNGSVGNIRLFQYESKGEVKKIVSVLMEIQLTKYVKYKPKPGESFGEAETEVIEPEDDEDSQEGATDSSTEDSAEAEAKSATPVPKSPHPESAF